MNLHPRHILYNTAELDLRNTLAQWRERHKLTAAEELTMLANETYRGLSSCVKTEWDKIKEKK